MITDYMISSGWRFRRSKRKIHSCSLGFFWLEGKISASPLGLCLAECCSSLLTYVSEATHCFFLVQVFIRKKKETEEKVPTISTSALAFKTLISFSLSVFRVCVLPGYNAESL